MPSRSLVSKELASLLSVLAHPDRIQIIEALVREEHNVNSLKDILGVSHSRVSQHLSLLRSHRLVRERHEGRRHYYRLSNPKLAAWIVDGLQFLDTELKVSDDIHRAVSEVRELWTGEVENESG